MLPARKVTLAKAVHVAIVPALVPLFEATMVVAAIVVVATVLRQRRRDRTERHRGGRDQAEESRRHAHLQ
jgi:hypothetical protein